MFEQARLPRLDVAYLARWSPMRWTFVGFVVFTLFYVVSPLDYEYSLFSWRAALYFVTCMITFVGGCYGVRWILGTNRLQPEAPLSTGLYPKPVHTSPDPMINITAAVAIIGVAARVFDRFIVRGFSLGSATFEDARNSLNTSISVFGYVGGALFSFGIICMMLIWLSSSQRRRPGMFLLAIALTVYPSIEAILQGSRSTVFHTAFIVMVFAYATGSMKWLFRSKLLMFASVVVMFGVAQLIYEIRTLEFSDESLDIADVYMRAGIAEFVHPPEWILEIVIATGGTGVIGGFVKVWAHLCQYLTHSFLVYCVNYDLFDGTMGYGEFHFFIPLRVIGAITGRPYTYDPTLYGMQPGFTATAISGVQYDFDAFGPLVTALFGAIAAAVHHKALEYPERWLPLHAYLSLAIFAIPLHTELVGGFGAFAIWSFILYVPLHYFLTALLRDNANAPIRSVGAFSVTETSARRAAI